MAVSSAASPTPGTLDYSSSVLVTAGTSDDNELEDYDWDTLL